MKKGLGHLDLLQDPALFCERYDSLNQFLEAEENWTVAERELRDRKVDH